MGKVGRSVLVLSMLMAVFTPAGASGRGDAGDNITCRLDGEATSGQAVANATCLQADPDTHGEFELALSVTLQVLRGSEWVDVDTVECTGESTRGLGQTACATAPQGDGPEEAYRGLIDLEAPKDWAPATAQPHYQGGEPLEDPLASDACDVNELVDTDLTAPDGPWADLCAVTMEHVLDDDGGLSVTVVIHVAGLVDLRPETTSWQANLNTDDCRHEVAVHDDGVIGKPGVRVDTKCHEAEPEPCNIIGETLAELTGGSCGIRVWEESETSPLDDTAVELLADQIRVTFAPDDLGPLGAADLVAGRTIASVDALATTGLGSREDESRVVLDGDWAYSTGRTYTFD